MDIKNIKTDIKNQINVIDSNSTMQSDVTVNDFLLSPIISDGPLTATAL